MQVILVQDPGSAEGPSPDDRMMLPSNCTSVYVTWELVLGQEGKWWQGPWGGDIASRMRIQAVTAQGCGGGVGFPIS